MEYKIVERKCAQEGVSHAIYPKKPKGFGWRLRGIQYIGNSFFYWWSRLKIFGFKWEWLKKWRRNE